MSRSRWGVLAVALAVVLVEASALLPAFDRDAIDARHRELCGENLAALHREPDGPARPCPADAYVHLRPDRVSPYPRTPAPVDGIVAHCPRHEPGLLVLYDTGHVTLIPWAELGVRDRNKLALERDSRDPRVAALGYE